MFSPLNSVDPLSMITDGIVQLETNITELTNVEIPSEVITEIIRKGKTSVVIPEIEVSEWINIQNELKYKVFLNKDIFRTQFEESLSQSQKNAAKFIFGIDNYSLVQYSILFPQILSQKEMWPMCKFSKFLLQSLFYLKKIGILQLNKQIFDILVRLDSVPKEEFLKASNSINHRIWITQIMELVNNDYPELNLEWLENIALLIYINYSNVNSTLSKQVMGLFINVNFNESKFKEIKREWKIVI